MALGLFRKAASPPPAPAAEPQAKAAPAVDIADNSEAESTRQILELLEIELGGMIRQLERAAGSVAGGAEATAATLSAVRQRTDALSVRSSEAQSTATIFSQAAGKFADSAQGITSHDATIASYAEQSGRSVIIVMNKWDLALEAAQDLSSEKKKRGGKFVAFNANKLVQDYEPLVRARLKFLSYAPIVFLSAKTGENIDRLYKIIDRVVEARRRRISTGELNRWLAKVDLTRGTSPASREVKIFYITQATTAPPTFVLFTNQLKPLHFSYQRFLENQLREEFDFIGTPIRFTQRLKKRGTRQRERPDHRKK